MSIRVNTLGKSAMINRQLNTAYDIVEYVADNLPFLLDLCKRLQTIKLAQEANTFINHINDTDIHLSDEQVTAINQIESIQTLLNSQGTDITTLTNSLSSLVSELAKHIASDVHITQEERDKWNSIEIPTLATVATTGSYNDLIDKPSIEIPTITIDSALSDTSTNPVENQAITNTLGNYVLRSAISTVGFTGKYSDLKGKPVGDTELDSSSDNWVCNKVITEAIQTLSNDIETIGDVCDCEALTDDDIDEVINNG